MEAAAGQFGVMEIDPESRVMGFEEKPLQPKPVPGDPGHALASMGIYVFTARFLFEQLCRDATRHGSSHDFGRNIIPAVIETHRVFAYPFMDENRKQEAYWRDVGTLDAYYEANMDLVSVDPQLNMYDSDWPIRTYQPNLPPPKFVFAEEGPGGAARPGPGQHRLPGLDRLRRPGGAVHRRALTRASTATPRSKIRSSSRAWTSAGTPRSAGRSSTRACTSPPASRSATTTSWTAAAASPVTDSGVTVIAKSDGVEHFAEKPT